MSGVPVLFVVDHPRHPERYQITEFQEPTTMIHHLKSGDKVVETIPREQFKSEIDSRSYS